MRTVDLARQENLCISCGVCKNLCPAGCISWQRRNGLYSPSVDTEKCIGCGICAQVCPGLSEEYELKKDLIDTVMGNVSAAYNAWSKDAVIRHVSGSGGVVSTLISTLLQKKIYDSAFCVDSYDYHEQLRTNMVCAEEIPSDWENSTTPKSRYLPVSHENAIAYIKENPGKRVIFIGTSCAVRAIRKALRFCHADPENYLFIGLFCDKVFNYCITDYIQNELCQGKQLSQLHFKNKESGGWPGNMKLFFSDGSYTFLDKEERSKVKDYFMPERCLYCADKLNVNADISVGDNYTDQDSSPLGSNSVLIRTEAGAHAWARANNELVFNAFEKEKLISAQFLKGRCEQLYFAELKQDSVKRTTGKEVLQQKELSGLMTDNQWDYERAWKHALQRIRSGAAYSDNPVQFTRLRKAENNSTGLMGIKRFGERLFYAVKRRIKSIQ